jgi:hypothetical protein
MCALPLGPANEERCLQTRMRAWKSSFEGCQLHGEDWASIAFLPFIISLIIRDNRLLLKGSLINFNSMFQNNSIFKFLAHVILKEQLQFVVI